MTRGEQETKQREELLPRARALLLHLRVQASLATGADGHEEGLSGSQVALDAERSPADESAHDDPYICVASVIR